MYEPFSPFQKLLLSLVQILMDPYCKTFYRCNLQVLVKAAFTIVNKAFFMLPNNGGSVVGSALDF
jgi:hypothetical protein